MIAAGEVGAVFEIKDLASATLKKLADQFNALEVKIESVKTLLKELAFPPGLNRSLGNMDKALLSIGESAGKAAAATADGFKSIDGSIAHTAEGVAALKREMASLGRGVGGGGGTGIRAHGTGGGGGHNPLRPGANILGHAAGVPGHLIDAAFSPGGLAIGAAAYAAVKTAEAGARVTHEGVNMALGGVSQDQITGATADSFRVGNKYGFNADQIMKALNEVRVPLTSGTDPNTGMQAARDLIEPLLHFATVARQISGKEGGGAVLDQLYSAIKSGEMRNVTDPGKYGELVEKEAQIYEGTSGRVSPQNMQTALKYMKTEGMTVSDDYLKYKLPAFIQEFNATTAGQMLARGYSAFIGGHQTKGSKAEGQRVGLYDENLNFKFQDDYLNNPAKAFQEMGDTLKAHGFNTEDEIAKEIGKITSNPNVGEAVAKGILGAAQLQRTENAIRAAMPADKASETISAKDPFQAWSRVTAGMENLAAAFGSTQMDSITKSLNSFADSLNAAIGPVKAFGEGLVSFDKWMVDHSLHKAFVTEPVVPGALPDDLAKKKAMFEKLNPTGGTKSYDPLSSVRAMPAPPPIVHVTPVIVPPATSDVRVYLDSGLIAQVMAENKPTNSSFDHDGRMGFAGPDVRN